MNTKQPIELPSPAKDIYRADGVSSAVRNYIETLELASKENPNNMSIILMKNACTEYDFLVSNKKILARNRKYFNQIHQNTVKQHQDIFIKTTARTKSWLSFYNKCRIKLHANKSLDSIKDIFACRTIIDSKEGMDTVDLIKKCYQIMDENINFFISLGFTPCDAEPLKSTENFDKSNFPELIVPEKSYLSEKNMPYVKDYIANPKENGYQSLHVIFKDTYGNYFEYQVRTYSMDVNADSGMASHETFKKRQKSSLPKLEIDFNKIRVAGYRYINDDDLDDSGLIKSRPILKRIYRIS